ncbi:MAG: DUF5677 domain-containing protein [Thermoanaerobaculia bacterium]
MITLPPTEEAIAAHDQLREIVAAQVHRDWEAPGSLFSLVGVKLFTFGFNTYKSVGVLLPLRHYEQGNSLFRTLWETAANFAWVGQDPDPRSAQFLGYTAVEFRKLVQRSSRFGTEQERKVFLADFDAAFGEFFNKYRQRRGGRERWFDRFSGFSLEDIIRDLGAPWAAEYSTVYKLACHYTHGSPGAILFPLFAGKFDPLPDLFKLQDDQRTAQLALWSMAILARLHHGWLEWVGADPTPELEELDQKLRFTSYLQEFSGQLRPDA